MVEHSPPRITGVLGKPSGWGEKLDELLPMVFDDLRRLARYHFSLEPEDYHTLQPTALISEVYLRLVGSKAQRPSNRRQFFTFAARLIREILIDHARARQTAKRGGAVTKVSLEEALGVPAPAVPSPEDLLTIDQALNRLEQIDPRQCRLVELRYFGGLTLPQAAEVLGISRATTERDWSAARRWLARQMQPDAR
ncbi:MAG: sigma-70 family RNA polymerase sigma factor [bacterium]|nr:sigma-70 family RNA polymerase sigma factor [bacterium]